MPGRTEERLCSLCAPLVVLPLGVAHCRRILTLIEQLFGVVAPLAHGF